jgi:putative MATE family efflux protein
MSQQAYTNKASHIFSLIKRAIRGESHDYTEGSIRIAIVLLAIPMILELSLESVFAVVDMFFVGKLGASAITTVGLTEASITIVYTVALGLSTGATAIVSRRVGEKNNDAATHAGMQSILIAIFVTAIISVSGIILAPDILRWMGAAPEVAKEGAAFTRIMLGGSLVIIMLFLINGIFRGAGDAAMAMRSLWIASLLNIFLCPMLINGYGPFPELGLKGAAIATTIGRGIGVIYQCYHLFKGDGLLKVKWSHFKWDIPVLKSIIKVSLPATLQFFLQSGSWMVMAMLVATTGGTNASAGYQIAIRNVVFFILPAWGLSNAAATLVGQNLGANRPDRAEESALLTTKYNALFMSFVMLLFLFFSSPIISIFTNDIAVHHYGVQALQIIGSGYIFYGLGMVMMQALNGAGDTRTPTWINFFCFWMMQIPLGYILAKTLRWGPQGAFVAIPITETILAIVAYWYFRKGKWKQVKV